MRRPLLLVLTAALLMPSHAVATGDTQRARARAIVREVLATAPARGTVPGIMVARGRTVLASRNIDDAFVPASIQKLATTSAALIRLGPDRRFHTRAMTTAVRPDGSVGKLVLVGGGDPTLASGAFRERYFIRRAGMAEDERVFPSGSPTIGELARAIDAAGVTRVRGNLLADETLFDDERTRPGWPRYYFDRSRGGPYMGYVSALAIDQGYGDIRQLSVASNPAVFAARRLRSALANRGIDVDGSVVLRPAPAGATEVARVTSPPLDEIVGWVNRWSANHPSELLLKHLGATIRGDGTADAGRRVVLNTLKAERVPVTGYRFVDGSGLSLHNRVRPRTVGAILRWALRTRSPAAHALRHSMAVACRPGTLLYDMCGSRAEGRLRGKSGLVDGVRGLAGWVRGPDGEMTVFVAIFNRARDESALSSTLNLLGRRLARFP